MVTRQFWNYGETAGFHGIELTLWFKAGKNDPRV